MRRIHVINGLKQRLNEILGTDATAAPLTDADGNPLITPWSIQAAMLEGMRRIAAALVGDAPAPYIGRPLSGLVLSKSGASLNLTAGYGVTSGGDVVWLRNGLSNVPISSAAGIHYFYLLYKTKQLDGTDVLLPEARNTPIIGDTGTYDIVYDDQAAYIETTEWMQVIGETVGTPLVITDTTPYVGNDAVYLGSYNTAGAVLTPNGVRGFPSYANDAIDATSAELTNLSVSAQAALNDVSIDGDLIMGAGSSITTSSGAVGDSAVITADGHTFTFVDGIFVSGT